MKATLLSAVAGEFLPRTNPGGQLPRRGGDDVSLKKTVEEKILTAVIPFYLTGFY
jgi:hypothetical protein